MWRIFKPGFIKSMKSTPTMEVVKMLPVLVKLKNIKRIAIKRLSFVIKESQ
jgi:hypothetical protein